MKPKLYEEVALLHSIPEENLQQGDIAVVVDYVPGPHGKEDGAVLEVFNAVGRIDCGRYCTSVGNSTITGRPGTDRTSFSSCGITCPKLLIANEII